MAGEVSVAREGSVNSLNGEKNGGRNIPRLYESASSDRYPSKRSLGISTRDETAEKDKAVLEGMLGQLSDGLWENSRSMEKYWRGMTFSQDEKGNVELRFNTLIRDRVPKWRRGRIEYDTKYTQSGYSHLTDKGVRDFLAGRIKSVYNAEKRDYPSLGRWSADNDNPSDYFGRNVTVADAYSLYKRLKG